MARVQQFYGEPGVPFRVSTDYAQVVAAWQSHRRRFRSWFEGLSEEEWGRDTRCSEWRVRDIAQHLVSGAQFLGYTLHQARKGEATQLLAGFDAQQTPKTTTAGFDGLPPDALLGQLVAMDQRVDAEIDAVAGDWDLPAEAPPGRVPAYLAVNHFLFDSWVHERDVMLPAGQQPELVGEEAAAVTAYVLALAGAARAPDAAPGRPLELHLELADLGQAMCVRRAAPSAPAPRRTRRR